MKLPKNAFLLSLLCLSFLSIGQQVKCHHTSSLVETLNKRHITPQKIDKEFSEKIISLYLEELDPFHNIFLKKDIQSIQAYGNKLHLNLESHTCEFLTFSKKIYELRLQQLDSVFQTIASTPFDQNSDENINFSLTPDYSSSTALLSRKWRKWLHFRTNEYIYNYHDNKTLSLDSLKVYEQSAREQITKKYQCKIAQKKKTNHVTTLFKAICLSFDPHTSFMTKEKKAKFQNALSRNTSTFGLSLGFNDNDAIIITYLSPNGPAWKSNLLHEDDIITSIKAKGIEYISPCTQPYTLMDDIEAKDIRKITLSFIHKGKHKTISLTKEQLIADDNSLKGFTLNGDKKIGYLSIPSFYTQWDGIGNGVASDVAKEILKLKRENIEGLILDLRNNGGGSVQEALDFIGIFINEGTLALAQLPDSSIHLLKDPNRGVIFEKPLVVMVNGNSASASETLSSSLQEYKRALIVGSPTYGKATGQNIENVLNKYGETIGHIKVTNLKLYKTNGSSNQKIGVQPDIVLKDVWDEFYDKEKDKTNSLSSDVITKKVDIDTEKTLPIEALSLNSQNRTQNSASFRTVYHYIDSLRGQKNTDLIFSLNYQTYQKQEQQLENNWTKIQENLHVKSDVISAKNNKFDNIIIQMNETVDSINKQIIENLSSDIYIEETYFIISDLINTIK